MEFKDELSKDPESEYLYRKVSEDGHVEIGICPVLLCLAILKDNLARGLDPFSRFPEQTIIPMYKDPACFLKLNRLLWESTNIFINMERCPDLADRKSTYIQKVWNFDPNS